MRDPKSTTKTALLAIALCLSLAPAVRADAGALLPEAATIDTTPSSSQDKSPPSSSASTSASSSGSSSGQSMVLQGGVRKHLHPPDATTTPTPTDSTQNPPLPSSATDSGAELQAGQGINDPNSPYKLAARKLDSGAQLTSDDYRALGAGCVGYESDRTFFQDIAKVSIVYKDSPAEKAGIKKGDKIIDHENDDEARANPSQPRQEVTMGQAGTPADIILLRHGKKEKVTLIRMNIEDIEEPEYRRLWEKLVKRLGYPKEGTYTGTTYKNMQRKD
jgi:hypothetical protein